MPSKHATSRIMKLTLLTALTCAASLPALAQKLYAIQDHWKIGGEGGWDYLAVDSTLHKLYITHGPHVEVLDLATGKPVGAITGLKGTHGVAFDLDGKLGYISDGRANAVIVFDRTTFATVASIPAGTNPDGILFEPVTKTVWAFNGTSKNVTVIDASTQKVTATVALPGKPEFPQADGTGNIYDNIEDTNQIVRLDARNPKITATWAACESPSGMAIDLKGHRLFSVCDGKKMAVVDYHSGKLLATPTIGDGPDAAGFDPSTNLAFASNGDGTLSIVDASSPAYALKQTLATEPRARTMALDPATGKVYLVTAKFGPARAATAANPRPRPTVLPDSFEVLVAGHE